MKEIIFLILLLITFAIFGWTIIKIVGNFRYTQRAYPVKNIGKRIWITIKTGFLQDKIFRNPFAGFMHALVFWGFCIILIGSIEMIIDGLTGTERIFSVTGIFYNIFIGLGDVFAYIILLFVVIFIIRRCCLNIRRLHGKEISKKNHFDAYLALSLILLLMVTLAFMNIFYIAENRIDFNGRYPVSEHIAPLFYFMTIYSLHILHEINWWAHILLIFIFANILPYSKHFHVFLSIPNVFFSRLEPLGKLPVMKNVLQEVKYMLYPDIVSENENINAHQQRFGVLDVEDITWKNYLDSLSCTQCGRCVSVCPANITGKELSPRKIFINIRERMKQKATGLKKEGRTYADGKSLLRDYIKDEEIWACTTCNACAKECPLNIEHSSLIVDLRRYIVLEESKAPVSLNLIFSNIENNEAPWKYSKEDRLNWTI